MFWVVRNGHFQAKTTYRYGIFNFQGRIRNFHLVQAFGDLYVSPTDINNFAHAILWEYQQTLNSSECSDHFLSILQSSCTSV